MKNGDTSDLERKGVLDETLGQLDEIRAHLPTPCMWPDVHTGPATTLIRYGRTCGHQESSEIPTCSGHLMTLQASPAELSSSLLCNRCNLYETPHISSTREL